MAGTVVILPAQINNWTTSDNNTCKCYVKKGARRRVSDSFWLMEKTIDQVLTPNSQWHVAPPREKELEGVVSRVLEVGDDLLHLLYGSVNMSRFSWRKWFANNFGCHVSNLLLFSQCLRWNVMMISNCHRNFAMLYLLLVVYFRLLLMYVPRN